PISTQPIAGRAEIDFRRHLMLAGRIGRGVSMPLSPRLTASNASELVGVLVWPRIITLPFACRCAAASATAESYFIDFSVRLAKQLSWRGWTRRLPLPRKASERRRERPRIFEGSAESAAARSRRLRLVRKRYRCWR